MNEYTMNEYNRLRVWQAFLRLQELKKELGDTSLLAPTGGNEEAMCRILQRTLERAKKEMVSDMDAIAEFIAKIVPDDDAQSMAKEWGEEKATQDYDDRFEEAGEREPGDDEILLRMVGGEPDEKTAKDDRVASAIAQALAMRESGSTKKASSEQEPETLGETDKQIRNTHVAELIFNEWSERHMPVCGNPRRREITGMILEDLKSGILGTTIIKAIKGAKTNTPYERISEVLRTETRVVSGGQPSP